MRILYLDCVSGASGDMSVGALLDLGGDFELLKAELSKLEIAGEFTVSRERVSRCGITATHFIVETHDHAAAHEHHNHGEHDHPHDHEHHHDHDDDHPHNHDHPHDHEHPHDHAHERDEGHEHGRSYADIVAMLGRCRLSDGARARALAMFRRIGEAEAKIHGVPLETVHFHEVGAVDSIVDITAVAILIDSLAPDAIITSAVPLGSGRVRTQHGLYPVPAPATLEILAGVPTRQESIEAELTTPTGAAVVAALADSHGPFPSMTIEKAGYGAGTRDFHDRPNVLRAVLGNAEKLSLTSRMATASTAAAAPTGSGSSAANPLDAEHVDSAMVKVEVNLDDSSGEIIGSLMERLFAAGANDVFYVPIYMKKNRPAVKLELLCREALLPVMREIIFRETTTFGLRYTPFTAHRLGRAFRTVRTKWGEVRIKEGSFGGEIVQRSPEFEDCRRIALERGVPLKEVFEAARRAAAE